MNNKETVTISKRDYIICQSSKMLVDHMNAFIKNGKPFCLCDVATARGIIDCDEYGNNCVEVGFLEHMIFIIKDTFKTGNENDK